LVLFREGEWRKKRLGPIKGRLRLEGNEGGSKGPKGKAKKTGSKK